MRVCNSTYPDDMIYNFSCVIDILLSLMYSRIVLMVVCWRFRIPFDANGYVSTLANVD